MRDTETIKRALESTQAVADNLMKVTGGGDLHAMQIASGIFQVANALYQSALGREGTARLLYSFADDLAAPNSEIEGPGR